MSTPFREWKKNQDAILEFLKTNPHYNIKTIEKFKYNTKFEFESPATAFFHSVFIGALGCIPAVGAVISTVYATIFNFVYDEIRGDDIWGAFYNHVQKLIEAELVEHHTSGILGDLNTIVERYLAFEKSKIAFKKNPQNNINYLYSNLKDLSDKFKEKLVDKGPFRSEKYSVHLLQSFTILATSHILFLYEVKENGTDWFYSDEEYNDFVEVIPNFINDYIQHSLKTYNEGCQIIKDLTITDSNNKVVKLTGGERFGKFLNFRSHCAINVFDYIDTWCLLGKMSQGYHKENVRYIWSQASGYPCLYSADKNIVTFDKIVPYNHPTYQGLINDFNKSEIEQYRGDLQQINVYSDDNWVYAMEAKFSHPDFPIKTSKIGSDYSFPATFKKEFTIASKITSTKTLDWGDIVPRFLSVDDTIFFNLPQPSKLYVNFMNKDASSGIFKRIDEYLRHSESNISVADHKLSNIYGRNNREILREDSATQVPIEKGTLDCLHIGFLPTSVFKENYLFEKVSTIINAQKYSSKTKCEFKADGVLPTIHSMSLQKDSTISFDFVFFTPNTKKTKYTVGVRYHHLNTEKTLVSYGGKSVELQPCPIDSKYTFSYFKFKFFNDEFDLKGLTNLKFSFSNPIQLHSIILTPGK